ncbi:MAG: Hachiman antiphage defense system protein HamA [Candidatus Thorarchaeota archaeon]
MVFGRLVTYIQHRSLAAKAERYRQSYLEATRKWLEVDDAIECSLSFKVIFLKESMPPDTTVIKGLANGLAELLLEFDMMVAIVKRVGRSGLRKILKSRINRSIPLKRGDFGEILTSGVLEGIADIHVPFSKLAYRILANQSLPGYDIIAVKEDRNQSIESIFFVETKLRTSYSSDAGKDALEQLQKTFDNHHTDNLLFTIRCVERKNPKLHKLLLDYMFEVNTNRIEENFVIGLVFEKTVWTDRCLSNIEPILNNSDYPLTSVYVVPVDNLSNLIDDICDESNLEVNLID